MNRITNKPYREINEKQKHETDDEAAFRFWELHKDRNDSPVVDLFHGQFKSTITCPECFRVSTTFDPFTTLSLPIPKLKKVDLFYVPRNNLKKTIKLSIFISEEALFFDIHDYLQQHLDFKLKKFRCLLIANNECLKVVNPAENIMKSLDKGFIFCCEIDEKISNADFIPLNISEDFRKDTYKSYPRMLTVHKGFSLMDLKYLCYKYARRFFEIPENPRNFGEGLNKIIKDFISENLEFSEELFDDLCKKEFFELFYPIRNINNFSFFKFNNNNNNKDKADLNPNTELEDNLRQEIISKFPFKFFISEEDNDNNNSPNRTVILDNEFFLEKNSFENLDLDSDLNDTNYAKKKLENLKNLENSENTAKDFFYNFNALKSFKSLLKDLKKGTKSLIVEINFETLDLLGKKALMSCRSIAVQEKTKNLTLDDCLNHFKLTEKLEKNNEWYCSSCKKHQKAFKKLELYYIPRNLIIHLKRFEYSSVGRYSTYADKIGKTVDFPLDQCCFDNYIIGPHNDQKEYDLYAVSQHFGGVGGGHYTAVCKNNGNWYDFNDSHCGKTSSVTVVSNSAYMLFYKRKEK